RARARRWRIGARARLRAPRRGAQDAAGRPPRPRAREHLRLHGAAPGGGGERVGRFTGPREARARPLRRRRGRPAHPARRSPGRRFVPLVARPGARGAPAGRLRRADGQARGRRARPRRRAPRSSAPAPAQGARRERADPRLRRRRRAAPRAPSRVLPARPLHPSAPRRRGDARAGSLRLTFRSLREHCTPAHVTRTTPLGGLNDMSELANDPVPPAIRDILALFAGELRDQRFGDLDHEALELLADETRARAKEVEQARAALESTLASLDEAREALTARARQGLAYASVYAASDPELSAKIAGLEGEDKPTR